MNNKNDNDKFNKNNNMNDFTKGFGYLSLSNNSKNTTTTTNTGSSGLFGESPFIKPKTTTSPPLTPTTTAFSMGVSQKLQSHNKQSPPHSPIRSNYSTHSPSPSISRSRFPGSGNMVGSDDNNKYKENQSESYKKRSFNNYTTTSTTTNITQSIQDIMNAPLQYKSSFSATTPTSSSSSSSLFSPTTTTTTTTSTNNNNSIFNLQTKTSPRLNNSQIAGSGADDATFLALFNNSGGRQPNNNSTTTTTTTSKSTTNITKSKSFEEKDDFDIYSSAFNMNSDIDVYLPDPNDPSYELILKMMEEDIIENEDREIAKRLGEGYSKTTTAAAAQYYNNYHNNYEDEEDEDGGYNENYQSYYSNSVNDIDLSYENLVNLESVKVGCTKEQKESIVETLYLSPIKLPQQKSDNQDTRCTICLDDFEKNQFIKVLPKCKHHYHSECIDKWLESSKICPQCRVEL